MDIVVFVFAVCVFVAGLLLTVAVHEAAHMWVARWFKIRVPDFFIGFGPKVFAREYKGTVYGFRAIPVGGYVSIEDEDCDDPEQKVMLARVHPMKRIFIFGAGAVINILIGAIIIVSVLMVVPYESVTSTIDKVNTDCSSVPCRAHFAGIQPGSTILEINGKKVDMENSDSTVTALMRNQENVVLKIRPPEGETYVTSSIPVENNRIGILLATEKHYRSFPEAVGHTGMLVVESVKGIINIPQKIPGVLKAIVGVEERAVDSPGSVVGAGRAYGEIAVSEKLDTVSKAQLLFFYMGGINLSIGLLNLVPLNPLDGGKIFFAIVDWVKMGFARLFPRYTYSPTSAKVMKYATVVPLVALVFLMSIFIVADVIAPIPLGL